MRWLPWLSVAVLLVLLLCHQWFGPDIWYHLYLGERVARTLTAQPPDNLILHQQGFLNLYWMFQLAIRGAYALGGIVAVSVFFMAFWGIAFGFWLIEVGRRVPAAPVGLGKVSPAGAWNAALTLVAVLICQTRFEQRPEILSYAFLAMQIHWLATWKDGESPRRWELFRFTLVEAIWSNVHGYFAFGPILVGLKIASLADPKAPVARGSRTGLWRLFALTALASIASPFGFRNWAEIAVYGNVLRQLRFAIQEALPTWTVPAHVWTVDLFWCVWAALLAAAIWIAFTAARKELFALLLAGLGLYLSTVAFRNIPLLVFLGAPLIAAIRPRIAPSPAYSAPVTWGVTLLAAGLGAWVVSSGFYRSMGMPYGFGISESRSAYPVSFAGYLRANGFQGSLFNSMADGGYLEFHFPGLRIYSDSRITDVAPVRKYLGALRDPRRFHELQGQCGFDGALLSIAESHEVIAALYRENAWRPAYADLHRVFFVNRLGSVGADAAVWEPALYQGEDLSLPQNEVPAILWVALFAELDDRQDLLRALRQFSSAPKIPSSLVEIALHFGWRRSDPEVVAAAEAMRPRVFQTLPISAAMLNQLLPPRR